ncbi:hypothetical protein WC1_01498 [Citrobacter sp. KTE30]|nr:hypothetical protein WC1_01498 [Citrobacter sp. KTE30]
MAPLTGIAFAINWLIGKLNLEIGVVRTTRMTTNLFFLEDKPDNLQPLSNVLKLLRISLTIMLVDSPCKRASSSTTLATSEGRDGLSPVRVNGPLRVIPASTYP